MEDSSGGKLLSDAEKEKVRGGASLQEGSLSPGVLGRHLWLVLFPPLSSSRGTLQEQTLPCNSDRYLKSEFCTMQDVVTRHPHSPLRTPKRNLSLWSLPTAPRVYLPPPISYGKGRVLWEGESSSMEDPPSFHLLAFLTAQADLEYAVE